MTDQDRKLRQAAFVYLHVGVLYEAAAFVMAREGLLPTHRGPPWVWLVAGAVVVAIVFWLLWYRRSVGAARVIWVIHGLRLPALIGGAFFPAAGAQFPPSFYLTALVVVVINLGFLARAGWDL
jgi:hypothetical protein